MHHTYNNHALTQLKAVVRSFCKMTEKGPEAAKASRTLHIYHQGFPLRPTDEVSAFHKLMRGRIGASIFLLVTIVLTVLPTLFISWPLLFFLVTGIVRRDLVRSFVNWSFGIWLYMESVSILSLKF